MKGTQTEVIGAPFFQFDKLADYLDDIDTTEDLLYGILGNQYLNESAIYPKFPFDINSWLFDFQRFFNILSNKLIAATFSRYQAVF